MARRDLVVLLDLATRHQVSFDDRGITLTARLGPAAALKPMIDGATAARDLFGRASPRSAYR